MQRDVGVGALHCVRGVRLLRTSTLSLRRSPWMWAVLRRGWQVQRNSGRCDHTCEACKCHGISCHRGPKSSSDDMALAGALAIAKLMRMAFGTQVLECSVARPEEVLVGGIGVNISSRARFSDNLRGLAIFTRSAGWGPRPPVPSARFLLLPRLAKVWVHRCFTVLQPFANAIGSIA